MNSVPFSLPVLSAINPGSAGYASRAMDPTRPKRPASAWIHFLSDFRKKNTELPGKEVMTSAGKEWKAMTVLQKKNFQDIFDAAKKVYEVNKAEYVKLIRDPEKPKKPITAFLLFLGEYRTKNASLKV